jgi:hypothetical protein|tara:strand:+ start:39 stop:455 length:417 start_codon:yes stop_codon:yes gene_type:complete
MAFAGYGDRVNSTGVRTQEYGYGLDDIQRASERLGRSQALNNFQANQQIKNTARSLPGSFNRRGMIDSGQMQRAREVAQGNAQLAKYGVAAQGEEAQRQLDEQRLLLDDGLYGGMMDDQVANALRRFAIAQTVQGLVS